MAYNNYHDEFSSYSTTICCVFSRFLPTKKNISTLPPPHNSYQVPGLIVPVATERLISSASYGRSAGSSSFDGSDSTDGLSSSTTIFPSALEHIAKVKKSEEALGINVELVDEGKNGVMVTSVAIGGPFARDGRIHAGDYLVAINNESLRNITNAQARAILRRAQLFSKDLRLLFLPSEIFLQITQFDRFTLSFFHKT